jgi:hypothetical protein
MAHEEGTTSPNHGHPELWPWHPEKEKTLQFRAYWYRKDMVVQDCKHGTQGEEGAPSVWLGSGLRGELAGGISLFGPGLLVLAWVGLRRRLGPSSPICCSRL